MIDGNLFTGDIGTMNGYSALVALFVNDNMFHGAIDGLSSIDRVIGIDLSNNHITSGGGPGGGIPEVFLRSPALKFLDAGYNAIRGTLPANISGRSELRYLSLRNNALSGSIPSQIRHLDHGLLYLDLSSNDLGGTLPPALGRLDNLSYLSLANNPKLEDGPIPHSFHRLVKLEGLSLKNTRRTGKIPGYLSTFERLAFLDLDNNGFSGTVPEALGALPLRHLLLNRNARLTGTLPRTFAGMTETAGGTLLLDGTGLGGDIDFMCAGGARPPNPGASGPDPSNSSTPVVPASVAIVADCDDDGGGPIRCACCECCPAAAAGRGCSNARAEALAREWGRSSDRPESIAFGVNAGEFVGDLPL